MAPAPLACAPTLREQAGASLLSRLVALASGLRGFRRTGAGRGQIGLELRLFRVGEPRRRTGGRQVGTRRIGCRSCATLRGAVGQAAERSRQVVGDGATGRAAAENASAGNERRREGALRQPPVGLPYGHHAGSIFGRIATPRANRPFPLCKPKLLPIQRIAASCSAALWQPQGNQAVGSYYGTQIGPNYGRLVRHSPSSTSCKLARS